MAVLISGESLYVAWLGDSQVVLGKAGQAAELMTPHKPDREVLTALLSINTFLMLPGSVRKFWFDLT